MAKIKVLVNGACGRMGQEVVKAISNDDELSLVGEVDILGKNKDLAETIQKTGAEVVVDFTIPKTIMDNITIAAENKANVIVGTTGLTESNLEQLKDLANKTGVNIFVAPNFAIGAVLMMKFSAEAAKYMPNVEIIEMHHDKKLDAPSGTAIKTADMIKKASKINTIAIHSVRLPGFVAHQEVIFGSLGQTLTIRHDSINRESFMPGVILAIKKIKSTKGLTYGLEHLL